MFALERSGASTVAEEKRYLPRKRVRAERYGVCEMTLWRWERDESLGFPKPISINGRKFYDVTELEAWERKRVTARAPTA